ncbi:MAG: tRNA (adenosine(37)-N6)-dimethylallyltransferase MiaA [Clostridia bacterium]
MLVGNRMDKNMKKIKNIEENIEKNINKNTVICIIGPTASGKTGLSIKLANKLNTEIISADSMQIYRGLNIGSAKVTEKEADGIKHHLIDIVDMDENFSVSEYKKKCYDAIDSVIAKGKTPVIVGGTGLYISAVVKDMTFNKENIDVEYRSKLYELARLNSNEYVHDILFKLDPVSASNIHPNNLKRVIRAIEMFKNNNIKSLHIKNDELNIPKYNFKIFCIDTDKELLNERINLRVDQMVNLGLVKEAKMVYNLNNCTAKQSIGYKEIFPYFENIKTLDECIDDIKLKTRQYAKRQRTWFKRLNPIYIKLSDKVVEEILENVYE